MRKTSGFALYPNGMDLPSSGGRENVFGGRGYQAEAPLGLCQ
ncbi:MAG: hypothetical protein RI565_09250 [Schleiferiaceae bacterium]|nr:hypothetical protein [Schleiferiaceae bacterium]